MNIHLPAILMFTRGTRFWHTAITSHSHNLKHCKITWSVGSSKSAHQVRECSAHCGDEHLEGRKQAGFPGSPSHHHEMWRLPMASPSHHRFTIGSPFYNKSAWWFQTWRYYFPQYMGYIILPIDELICFKMVKTNHQPEIMVTDDLEVPRWRKPAIFLLKKWPSLKGHCHGGMPHFQTPKFAVLVDEDSKNHGKIQWCKKPGKTPIYSINSYISINKQVTIRDINGVKLLKSVIILNLLHFWNFLLYLWFEILATFLRGAISKAAEKWRRLRQPEAIPQNCDVKQRECIFFLLFFFSTFGDRQAETWQQGWAVSSEANIMALRAKTGARGHGATEST